MTALLCECADLSVWGIEENVFEYEDEHTAEPRTFSRSEPFNFIALTFVPTRNLTAHFAALAIPESVSITTETGINVKALKTTKLILPDSLIIQLKRTDGKGPQNMTPIAFTAKWLDRHLCAVITWSQMDAHFTAFVRRATKWYHCNDSVVKEVDTEEVMSTVAFFLFYSTKF